LFSGYVKLWLGEPEAAIERVTRAIRLSPQDAQYFNMQNAMAQALILAGRYDDALTWAEAAVRGNPNYIFANSAVAISAALGGRPELAQRAVARMCRLQADLRLAQLMEMFPLWRPEDRARWVEGLRKAGVPE
jgi:tetratricopeptide (TPR) repeat protein